MSVFTSKFIRDSSKFFKPLFEQRQCHLPGVTIQRNYVNPSNNQTKPTSSTPVPPKQISVSSNRSVHVAPPRNVLSAATKIVEPYLEEEFLVEDQKNLIEFEDKSSKWLWKATEDDKLYHTANTHGTRSAFGYVTLNSAKPLDYELMKESFRIVQRGCQNLRMAFCPRGDELWVKEFFDSDVDFQVLPEDSNYLDVIQQSGDEGFDSTEKPHWRVRLIPRNSEAPCKIPGIKDKFPFQYDYILHPNHAFVDGINIAFIVHLAFNVLEGLLSGKTKFKQFGDLSGLADLANFDEKIKKSFQENPKNLVQQLDELPTNDKSLWVTEAFGRPVVSKPKTKHILRNIDADVMKSFNAKCKNTGITFNSALVILINAAFVDLMTETGVARDTYRFDANILVNLRRYLKNQKSVALGAFSSPFSHSSIVGKDIKNNYWEYTRQFHRDLQSKLDSSAVLEQRVIQKMMAKSTNMKERFMNPPNVVHDYGVTNLGDLTSIIPGSGKHVQISDLGAYNSIHKFIHNQLHQVISYKGHCTYTISYDTSYLSDETANRIADKVIDLIRTLPE